MVKTLTTEKRTAKPRLRSEALLQTRSAEEFDADTQEDRPVSMLAEKRRQFLAGLAKSSDDSRVTE